MAYSKEQVLSVPGLRERSILRNVYVWMTLGLALTGVVSWGIASNASLVRSIVGNPVIFFGAMIGELVLVMFLSARIMKMSVGAAATGFAAYAALNGVTMSVIFLAYTGSVVASAFFVSAGTFAAMSLYAMSTKRSLASWGTYLTMALFGVIIASVVNYFLRSPGLDWIISYAGVALFMGLTAYDTQMIKRMSDSYGTSVDELTFTRLSIIGALKLYLDFINLFLFVLRIMGRRR